MAPVAAASTGHLALSLYSRHKILVWQLPGLLDLFHLLCEVSQATPFYRVQATCTCRSVALSAVMVECEWLICLFLNVIFLICATVQCPFCS